MQVTSKSNGVVGEVGEPGSAERRLSRIVRNAARGLALTPSQVLQFVDAAPFAFALFDRNMVYAAHSQRWVEDYNLQGKRLVGRSHYDIFPNMTDDWRERYDKCLAGQEFESQESKFTGADGRVAWIKWEMTPWTEKDGEIGGLILFSEIITQQKLKEKELEKNQQFLTAVLDSVQDGIVACDEHGTLTLFNTATRALHGLPEQPIPADKWADHYNLYRPDGVTPLTTKEVPLFRALNGEKVRGDEMVIAPKGREAKRVLSRGQAMADSTGNIIGAVASMHDITEQAKAADDLREREQQFRTLYNDTPAMLHSVNANGELIRVSDHWLKTLGYTRDEVIGRRFAELLPEDSQQYVREQVLPQFVRDGHIENVEFEVKRKDGRAIDIQLSAIAQHDDQGDVISSLTVLTDIIREKTR